MRNEVCELYLEANEDRWWWVFGDAVGGMGNGMGNILEEKKTRLASWRRKPEPKAKPAAFLPDFRAVGVRVSDWRSQLPRLTTGALLSRWLLLFTNSNSGQAPSQGTAPAMHHLRA